MLRHIFPFPRTLPIHVRNGSRLVVLPVDPRGCRWQRVSKADPPGLMDFPNIGVSEAFHEALIHGHKQIFTFRTCHGPAWFLICFLLLDCGWWGMKGCSMVRDVDFGSFRPPVAIISLGSRWLHVVDFTTFVGAVHQLKARSRDGSRTWDLRMGWMLGTHPMVIYPSKMGHGQRKDQQKPIYLDLSLRHHSSTWQRLPATWWDCATCLSCRTGGGTCGCCSL